MNTAGSFEAFLVRHGETAWSAAGRHTGRSDVPLTAAGEAEVVAASAMLRGKTFGLVLCSPLKRARRTCELAGLLGRAELRDDLQEWDYGDYEGITSAEIRKLNPNWNLWRDGCPGGESPQDVRGRCERITAELRAHADENGTDAIVFAHGHLLRALAATWCGEGVELGERLMLSTSAVSVLGQERGTAAIKLWNHSPPEPT